jgi:hypothetical protein
LVFSLGSASLRPRQDAELPAPSTNAMSRPEPPVARQAYNAWPGLTNPLHHAAVRFLRDDWAAAHTHKRVRRFFKKIAHRSLRGTRRLLTAVGEELTAAPKKTLVEILLGLPIALLSVDPYRSWVLKWHYAWDAILALILANFFFGIGRRIYARREATRRISRAAEYLQLVIECARPHVKEGAEGVEPTEEHLRHSIAIVLQAMVDLVRQVLQVPHDVKLHSNLMIPMPVRVNSDPVIRDGAGIVCYSLKRPAEPAWTRLVMGDFGAGEAFVGGKVCVIEDTRDPEWCGVFGKMRSRCFGSFPVLEGSGKAFAVVNIDADRSFVLRRKNAAAEVYQTLVGPLALLADILLNTKSSDQAQTTRSLEDRDI